MSECRVLNHDTSSGPLCSCAPGVCALDLRVAATVEGYPVRLTKYEARLLQKRLTMQVDFPELEPEHQALYEKLEAVL